MRLQRLQRYLSRVSPLLVLLLAIPRVAICQAAAPGQAVVAPEARERLAQAAEESQVAPWQRDLMLRLARTGTSSELDSSSIAPHVVRPALASGPSDGAWNEPVIPGRYGHSAIYDPVRDRVVVFGGCNGPASQFTYNEVWELSLAGTLAWTLLSPSGTPPHARYYHSAIYDPVRDRMVVFGGSDFHVGLSDVWALSLAGTPAWTQLVPSGTPPSGRYLHSAIYDPVRDQMVVFAGDEIGTFSNNALDDVWALSLGDTLAWTALFPSWTTRPTSRAGHSAIYDPLRDRMLVFGGYSSDVWALSLAGTPAWTQLIPSGTLPSPRYIHSSVYDPVRDRMVVFGGFLASALNDVWSLSLAGTPVWTSLAPSSSPPGGRYGHGAIYDPVRDRMVVLGGFDNGSYHFYNDIWALSLAGAPAWTPLAPSNDPPPGRYNHTAICDPMRDRMLVFGGGPIYYPLDLNDLWALSLAGLPAWTELTPSGSPPARRIAHSAIYDPVRDRMLVFGGIGVGVGTFDDVWALSLAGPLVWTQLAPTGTPPSARWRHSAIYDPVRDRMVVFGGFSGYSLNDVWALSLAGTPAWAQLTPTGVPPRVRSSHSAIYDPVRDRMIVFGGYDENSGAYALGDVWDLSLAGTPTWTQLTPSGTPTSRRYGHSAIYDPVRNRMVVFGGSSDTYPGDLNDVSALSLTDTPTWTQLAPSGTPPPRRVNHSAIYDPVHPGMVVFGGLSDSELNDVWELGIGDAGFPTPALVELFRAVPTDAGVRIEWELSDPFAFQSIALERAASAKGGWAPVVATPIVTGRTTSVLDATATAGEEWWYRLGGVRRDGRSFTIGPVSVTAQAVVTAFALPPLSPNPTRGHSLLTFAIPTSAAVRLSVMDVQGREVALLANGMREPGSYTASLEAGDLPAGIYFVRLQSKGVDLTRRLVVVK